MRTLLVMALLITVTACATSQTEKLQENYPTVAEETVQRAEAMLSKGKVKAAERRFKVALSYFQQNDDLENSAIVYNRLGFTMMIKDDIGTAEKYLNSARVIAEKESYSDTLFDVLINLTYLYIDRGERIRADKTLEIIERSIPAGKKSEVAILRGIILMEAGKLIEAETKFNAVIKSKSLDGSEKSSAYSNLGSLYLKKGKYSQAIEQFQLALKSDKEKELPLLIGPNLHQIGKAYEKMGDTENALYFYNRALNLNMQLDIKNRANADRKAIERIENQTKR